MGMRRVVVVDGWALVFGPWWYLAWLWIRGKYAWHSIATGETCLKRFVGVGPTIAADLPPGSTGPPADWREST